jgi:hypothetical protein
MVQNLHLFAAMKRHNPGTRESLGNLLKLHTMGANPLRSRKQLAEHHRRLHAAADRPISNP